MKIFLSCLGPKVTLKRPLLAFESETTGIQKRSCLKKYVGMKAAFGPSVGFQLSRVDLEHMDGYGG
jgi:hypothetical protein